MSNPNRMEKVTMIDEGRVEGFASDIGSKRPDAVGDMAGDTATRADRKANQAAGQAHDLYKWIVDEIRQLTTDRSFGALLAAMATGMAIGFLISRR
jgi:uncharacterized protein YjbJ (UPF0337 family)